MKIVKSLAVMGLFIFPALLYADGIDLYAYCTRVGTAASSSRFDFPFITLLVILLLMAVNYALNFIFIGLPAAHFGKLKRSKLAKDLIWLTLGGQVADRLGALLALFLPMIFGFSHVNSEASMIHMFMTVFLYNFVFSGLAIAALVVFFCLKIWRLNAKQTAITALLAGILTNPAYLLFIGFRL